MAVEKHQPNPLCQDGRTGDTTPAHYHVATSTNELTQHDHTPETADHTVAVLTLRLIVNYGGILQNYALQTTLKQLGYSPVTLRYTYLHAPYPSTPSPFFFQCLSALKRMIMHRVFGRSNCVPYRWWLAPYLAAQKELPELAKREAHISQYTRPFIQKYIHATREYDLPYETEQWKKMQFKRYVVGSDQVWRFPHPFLKGMLFLDFTRGRRDIRRVAYAASFGQDSFDPTHFGTLSIKEIQKYLQGFDAISTREESGVKICHDLFQVPAVHMPDPTMLLTQADYCRLIFNKYPDAQEQKTFVMTYILDPSPEKSSLVLRVQGLRRKPLRQFTLPEADHPEVLQQPPAEGVEEWLKGFLEADFVITDSFHGTVFSLLFNKPFLVIPNGHRGLARFHSLLEEFGLTRRMLTTSSNIEQLLAEEINFSAVNAILAARRSAANDFLKQGLQ